MGIKDLLFDIFCLATLDVQIHISRKCDAQKKVFTSTVFFNLELTMTSMWSYDCCVLRHLFWARVCTTSGIKSYSRAFTQVSSEIGYDVTANLRLYWVIWFHKFIEK